MSSSICSFLDDRHSDWMNRISVNFYFISLVAKYVEHFFPIFTDHLYFVFGNWQFNLLAHSSVGWPFCVECLKLFTYSKCVFPVVWACLPWAQSCQISQCGSQVIDSAPSQRWGHSSLDLFSKVLSPELIVCWCPGFQCLPRICILRLC